MNSGFLDLELLWRRRHIMNRHVTGRGFGSSMLLEKIQIYTLRREPGLKIFLPFVGIAKYGLQRAAATRCFDEGPKIPEGRSKTRSFAAAGLPWGHAAAEAGAAVA